jgi:hypothetical protein
VTGILIPISTHPTVYEKVLSSKKPSQRGPKLMPCYNKDDFDFN